MAKKAKVQKINKAKTAKKAVVTTATPLDEQNGIKRPREGGKCAAVWDAMQAIYEKTGSAPTNADARQWAESTGANVSNAIQEVARYRKFAGLTVARVVKEVKKAA